MKGADILNKLLKYSELNGKSFSEKIGLIRPQSIYDIQNGKTRNISPSMANKIISVFPEVNRVWLLTGEGEMLKNGIAHETDNGTSIGSGKVIPYYDAEVAAGTEYGMEMTQTSPVDALKTINYVGAGVALVGTIVLISGLHKEYVPGKGLAVSNHLYLDSPAGLSLAIAF